jgi:prepilin-type N-terminal cleavage/methylation domain-containing protein
MIKNKKGFTLIELLIVIAIISILAAAVVVGINPGQRFKAARNATRWSHMNSIATAIYSYAVENAGSLPNCIPLTTDTPPTTTAVNCSSTLVATYTTAIPEPPLYPDEEYVLERTAQGGIKITSTAQEAIDEGVELTQ